MAVGECFTNEVAHAPQIAAPGNKGANLDHGIRAGFAHKRLQPVADLLGQEAARREGRYVKRQLPRLSDDRVRQVLGELQCLRLFFFFLLPLRRRSDQREHANRQHERNQPRDAAAKQIVPGNVFLRVVNDGWQARTHGLNLNLNTLTEMTPWRHA